jgi:uncharacterized protein
MSCGVLLPVGLVPPTDGTCPDSDRESGIEAKLMRALSSPAMYGGRGPVVVRETHASWVFVAGDRALKVKKPVALGFLDYGTLTRRHAACREEVRVNEPLAPGIYLGVRAIVKRPDGFCFAPDGAHDAVEYAVEMRSFDEAHTLAGMIAAGSLTCADVRLVGERLAGFHRSAPTVAGGGPREVLDAWRVNVEQLRPLAQRLGWDVEGTTRFAETLIGARGQEIEQRTEHGLVRDGHGDLRCEHVLVGDPVRIVDRIEFDPALRHVDVAADLSFLTMDLEARGQRAAARTLVCAYRRAGGDPGSEVLRSFYAAHRALVRAKVALVGAAGHEQSRRSARYEQAEQLWALAERLCWRARGQVAIVVCGPPASGKSTLAAELSRRSHLPVVSSDVVRKRLAGLPATARARAEHYTDEFTRRTYERLAEQALACLRGDGGVIVDATCHSPQQRARVLKRLKIPGSTYLVVHCNTDLGVALARVAARMNSRQRISDATPEIVGAGFYGFQPPQELPAGSVLKLATESSLQEQVAAVTAALDARLAPAA